MSDSLSFYSIERILSIFKTFEIQTLEQYKEFSEFVPEFPDEPQNYYPQWKEVFPDWNK